jgi:hypothetical protein
MGTNFKKIKNNRQIHLPPETTTINLIVKLIAMMKQV